MKVIHIAGWSGSGKTTFILDLVVALTNLGPVGTIKHIGDHVIDLPQGKDTTRHFKAGAQVSIGIDQQKMQVTTTAFSLKSALDMLSHAGMRFAVVEGFKTVPFKKVVIGDLDVPALVRDPVVPDILSRLDSFDSYYTLSELVHKVESDGKPGSVFTMMGVAPSTLTKGDCRTLERDLFQIPGVTGACIRRETSVLQESPRSFVVIRTTIPGDIGAALSRCRIILGMVDHH
jgi:molybdopterin-guanine dinucleotide biosynthesis protein MobB